MTISKTLRNPARAASELNARFNGESSKGANNGQPVKGPAGIPNRLTLETATRYPQYADAWSAKRTRRQHDAYLANRRTEERFVMPEHKDSEIAEVSDRIEFHRAMISGNVGKNSTERRANSAKARLEARLIGMSAKMEHDSSGRRVNGSDPFAAMRAECHARLGLHLGFAKANKVRKAKPAESAT